ncbi:indolepyruvate ferredoxin oxidoreductase family protein [soil metagenome]
MSTAAFDLRDRLGSTDATIAMSGIQALVRIPLDQHRADAIQGLHTAALICGYRGSPVGGMDQAYEQNRELLQANYITFVNGVNEDLAVTAVWGTQLTALEPKQRFDGVLGMWYGKGPGVDRSGDALRHANISGVAPNGGVLAVAGDDPSNKSSTIPSASEWSLADLAIPVLFPGNVQEVLDYGRFGYALSRFCGAWVGFKIQTNVADAYATVDPRPERLQIMPTAYEVGGSAWRPTQSDQLLGKTSLRLEEEMFTHRLRAAEAFIAAQGLDRTIGATGPARLGVIAAGVTYYETLDALARLGIGPDDLAGLGIRIHKPAMIWPLEPTGVTAFADGLEEILVIEEKRSFIERQVRDLLYGRPDNPRVVGKTDEEGRPLIGIGGALLSDDLLGPLRVRLGRFVDRERLTGARPPLPMLDVSAIVDATAPAGADAAMPDRTAYFCSGCPHNRSTVVPEGSVAGGGIGCHAMALSMDRDTVGITHMGGEGAQWVGIEPFVEDAHRFQNLGDGTMSHSGSLAIRQAVAAGSTITYKILYNGTVAMTGGQDAAGQMPVPELTRWLAAEGVVKTVVVSAEPDSYPRDAAWAVNARVEPRDNLDPVQRELREIPGVTALIYDQACAAELRRDRKRGNIATPGTRVMIDQRICEGCGHCGEISNCASVHPVMTPFGRKTEIHQESCNLDLTCLDGNCPAFVTVEIDPEFMPGADGTIDVPVGAVPSDPQVPEQGTIVMVGIGGTGVVTMSQIVSTAALLDGRQTNSLDQTGLAQKGGTVVSNLRIGPAEVAEASNYIGDGEADVLLLFDLVSGVNPTNLARAAADRTVAIVSTGLVPTGAMVSGRGAETFPDLQQFHQVLDPVTRADDNVWLDAAGIAKRVFASQPLANALVVGVAYQRGLLPVTGASIRKAIELNGVAVQANLDAFDLGRRLAVEPDLWARLGTSGDDGGAPTLSGRAARLAGSVDADGPLAEILAWRVPELIAYQDAGYAQRYAADVARVRRAELALGVKSSLLSQTVARHLYKLMAYKDEYEVARLALDSDLTDQARSRFGPGAKVSYRLKPPTLKALGYDTKISIPEPVGRVMFAGLAKAKRLRGTRLDPFGRSHDRRVERQLISDYRKLIDTLLEGLDPSTYDQAVAIADLADQIRGYDTIKLANVERYRADLAAALSGWDNRQVQSQSSI